MKSERWQQVEQLYHSALEKDERERASFLDEACAGDDKLRREVESLLSYEGQAEEFIESPALEVAARMVAEHKGAAVLAGHTINQYRVTSHLGTGGMGEVFLAEDTRLGRRVALKFLPELFTQDKRHLRRFEQEARAVAALSHPNVCTIHEVIETEEGRHCIVMEFVDGLTLRASMAEKPMKVGEAIDVGIQVASALAAAHAAGIAHRDIKPENIMLRRDGYAKVLDFGLAKLSESETTHDAEAPTKTLHTSPGMVMGTVWYMSPEQARGLPVDARTDIWSLGVVLYEMVAGHKPFVGETPTDVIISISEREPVPLTSCGPEVPVHLDRIVQKALAKDREARYQTAQDLLTDLKTLRHELEFGAEVKRHHQPVAEFPATKSNRDVITSRIFPSALTPRRMVFFTAITGLLIVTGLFGAQLFRRSDPPLPQTEIKSLAVLPLENESGDAAQDYFADGMTDTLISGVSRIQGLRVMSRPALINYKKASKSPAEIGRELKLDAVITGSVQRNGDHVRLSLQLTHVSSGQDLWTKKYERELRDALALQSDVARDVAERIGLRTPLQQQAKVPSVHAEAYDQYLRGQFYMNRQNREDNEAAIAALEGAVAKDPNFAAAHAELAQAYVWKLFLFAPSEKQLEEKAFVEVEKALALDPDSAVAYLARGRLLWTPANHFPHDRSIKEYRHALSLNPSLGEAHNQLALVYSHIGAFPEAIQESQLALAADPNNHLAQYRIGQTLNYQGKYDDALSVLRSIPQQANPDLVGYQIAWSLFNLGRQEEANAAVEQLLKDYPKDNGGLLRSVQAILAASTGQEHLAEDKIKTAIEKGKGFGHFHHTAYHIACAYALMNKPEQAIKWLENAAEDGFPCYPLFETDSNLKNLRQDARFVAFLSKAKQKWEYYKTIL